MDDAKLERYLRSVGKGCFVNHFDLFGSESVSQTAKVERQRARELLRRPSC